jgi:excisionase family DNA binding protein
MTLIKERLLTTGEVALALHVSPMPLRSWYHRGLLHAVRLPGGHFRIPASEVIRLKNGLPLEAPLKEVLAGYT